MVTVAKRRGVFIEWRLVKMLTLALMILMLGAALFFLLRPTASERGTQSLVKAFSKRRLIEPRLSGGFKAGVFIEDKNKNEKDRTGVSEYDLNRAEELIEDAVNDNNPKTQLAYGDLLMSTLNNADALKQFRKAVSGSPESAEPHNDIGVCLMESGKLEDALEEFNAALKFKDAMPEALFNRGLCYERLLLRDAANEDYTRLIKVERDRSWLGETRERQEAMSAPIEPMKQQNDISEAFDAALGSGDIEGAKSIAKQYLEIVLKHAYVTYPLQYLKARNAGKLEEAGRALSDLQWVGQYFIEASEDSSIADLASYLRDLPPEKLQSEMDLINRHLQAEARKSVTGKDLSGPEAQATYQELAKQFEQEGNHLFYFFSAQNDATYDHYIAGKYHSAVAKLTNCLKIIDKYPWSYRKAQVYSNLGNAGGKMAQDALGLKYCDQALIYCKNAPSLKAKILQYKAHAYTHLGDVETGLARLRESTRLLMESAPQFGELAVNCLLAADFYRLINNHSLAMLYSKQALAFAEEKQRLAQQKSATDAARTSDAASLVAVEHARLNQTDQAQQQMQLAFAQAKSAGTGSDIQFIALMRAAEIASLQNNTALALDNYNKAEGVMKGVKENTLYMMSLLRGRAEVYAQAGDYEHAAADLKRAISLIEYYFATISERKDRSNFLDVSHNVFDRVIALNIQAFSKGEEAFDYSERSRARALLDDIAPKSDSKANQSSPEPGGSPSNASSKPMALAQVQAALPEDLRLVTYSVTDKGTFIFLITHSGFEWAESPVTTGELDRLAQDYVFGIKNMASIVEISEAARKLYGHLIRPVANKINDGKQLCIVPDKALNLVPFAALIDDSDQYLVESLRLTYAPSATVLALCLEESRRKGANTEEKILAVGNPMFNRDKFYNLAEIPEAEQEAIESAALYGPANREILIGASATKQKVRAALPNCDIAHLALHCLVNEKTPLLAALVLADPNRNQTPYDQEAAPITPGAQDDSLLYLNDIYSLNLPRTKLVILSACNSALGQYYRGEGIVSLVRPFLARRVPTVIASLWPVSSQATAALMIDFHRERKRNITGAGDALRAAQRRMVRSSSYQHPFYWAAFMVVGSNA